MNKNKTQPTKITIRNCIYKVNKLCRHLDLLLLRLLGLLVGAEVPVGVELPVQGQVLLLIGAEPLQVRVHTGGFPHAAPLEHAELPRPVPLRRLALVFRVEHAVLVKGVFESERGVSLSFFLIKIF